MNAACSPRDIIVVGASAGGVQALLKLFAALPSDLSASVLVALHRSPYRASYVSEVYGRRSALPVADAVDGEPIERNRIYFAPPDAHLIVERHRLRLARTPRVNFTRPAVDPLFESAARVYGPRVVGVLLSGSGSDGVHGLIAIKALGGFSIVQHPVEAEHPMMPMNAMLFDHVDAVLSIEDIAAALIDLARTGTLDFTKAAG